MLRPESAYISKTNYFLIPSLNTMHPIPFYSREALYVSASNQPQVLYYLAHKDYFWAFCCRPLPPISSKTADLFFNSLIADTRNHYRPPTLLQSSITQKREKLIKVKSTKLERTLKKTINVLPHAYASDYKHIYVLFHFLCESIMDGVCQSFHHIYISFC